MENIDNSSKKSLSLSISEFNFPNIDVNQSQINDLINDLNSFSKEKIQSNKINESANSNKENLNIFSNYIPNTFQNPIEYFYPSTQLIEIQNNNNFNPYLNQYLPKQENINSNLPQIPQNFYDNYNQINYNISTNTLPYSNPPQLSIPYSMSKINNIPNTNNMNAINTICTDQDIPIEILNFSQNDYILNIKKELIKKLDKFYDFISDYFLQINPNSTKSKNKIEQLEQSSSMSLKLSVIDLEKTSKFNYDLLYYSLPENFDDYIYTEYNLYNHSLKIAQILKLSSILYEKCINYNSSNKRELYYNDVELFKSTDNIDNIINDLCSLLMCHRFELPIFPSAKGLFCGNIELLNSKNIKMNINNINNVNYNKINLISFEYLIEDFNVNLFNINNINNIYSSYFILIVEKETIFFNLIQSNFFTIFPNAIIITGKGYPDYITKVFINKLHNKISNLNIPFYYFGDNDPYGLEIFLNYLFGSKTSSKENEFMCMHCMKWIGLNNEYICKINEVENEKNLNLNNGNVQGLIKLCNKDIKKIENLKKKEFFIFENLDFSTNCNKDVVKGNLINIYNELNFILNRGFKAEGEYLITRYMDMFIECIMINLQSDVNKDNNKFGFNGF